MNSSRTFKIILFVAMNLAVPALPEDQVNHQNLNGPKGYPAECSTVETAQFLTLAGKLNPAAHEITSAELSTLTSLFKKIPRHCIDSKTEERVEAVARFYQLVPCDLKNLPKKIKVKLSCEDHTERSAEVLRGYYDRAESNQIMLLFEAYLDRVPDETPRQYKSRHSKALRVVDGEATVGFSSCIVLADQWNRRKADPEQQVTKFVGFLANPLIFEQVFEKAIGNRDATWTTSTAKTKEFYNLVSDTYSKSLNLIGGKAKDPRFADEEGQYQKLQSKLEDFARNNPKTVKSAWEAVRDYWIGRVTSESGAMELVTVPTADAKALKHALDGDKNELHHLARLFSWEARERNMAYEVVKGICHGAAGSIKDGEVVLHMGAGHVPFVFDLIAKALKNSGAGDKVEVQVDVPLLHAALIRSGDHDVSDDLGARPTKDIWKFLRDLPKEAAFRDDPQYRIVPDYFKDRL